MSAVLPEKIDDSNDELKSHWAPESILTFVSGTATHYISVKDFETKFGELVTFGF